MNGRGWNAGTGPPARRRVLGIGAGVALFGVLGRVWPGWGVASSDVAGSAAVDGGYPRAWFFRGPENVGLFEDYDAWAKRFGPLGGIQGKVFREERGELPDRTVRRWFGRYARRHPDELVLAHFNGKGRRPAFANEYATINDGLFAGHWLYYAGTTTTAALSGDPRDTLVRVDDPSVFKKSRGNVDSPDDIVMVPRTDSGLDWEKAEQVTLVPGDTLPAGTIRVTRARFGTSPRPMPARSYLAPHVRFRGDPIWMYNYSAEGLRNARGRRCIDVLAEEIAGWFAAHDDPDDPYVGALRDFAGLQFDVLYFMPDGRPGKGPDFAADQDLIDVDTNGRPDSLPRDDGGDGQLSPGFASGVNVYGQGVTEFHRLLRESLPDKIIMADGMLPQVHQRSFMSLSGIESEGFPSHTNPSFSDWSGGLNRFEFWKSRGAGPRMNYQVVKYNEEPGDDPYNLYRLSLAAAQFTDSALTSSGGWFKIPEVIWRDKNVPVRVLDELWRGVDQRPGWLGRPDPGRPAVHLAARAPDLLAGTRPGLDGGARIGVSPDTGVPVRTLGRRIVRLEGDGKHDIFVTLRMKARPLADYPDNARRISMRLRDREGRVDREIFGWADREPFTSTFAFHDLDAGTYVLTPAVEGEERVSVIAMTAHDHPDVMYREFPGGLVLANPSGRPFTFRLPDPPEGGAYRRIRGDRNQDPAVNSGRLVEGDTLTVPGLDARFLVIEPRPD